MIQPRFVHLRVHSEYSMSDGLVKISSLVKKTADMQMAAIAITDFNNLFGLIKFYKIAHNFGIKPIIGADIIVKNNIIADLYELTILAANNVGYKNLTMLISKSYQNGYGYFGPVIDIEWLTIYSDGLIIISGGIKGDVGKNLLNGNIINLEKCIKFYDKYFPDRYYIEIIRTGRKNEEKYLYAAANLAYKSGLPLVATNDVRFISPDDFNSHEIRVAIYKGLKLNDLKKQKSNYSNQQYMRSEHEMCKLFYDFPDALENSVKIAIRCNVNIIKKKYFLPKFPTGSMSTEKYLIQCAHNGLEERFKILFTDYNFKKKKKQYKDRLNKELNVINKMGFSGYFLIVMEFINWAKKKNIPVGPGRGSGAGSLVAYALKITDIDPISFNLLFERFLNFERVSMPDFDIDLCMEKRDIVIEHVSETYGRESVSQIITFGTLGAKAVIRDVGRVLGFPYSVVHRVSKLIPYDSNITIDRAFILEPKLKYIYYNENEIKVLIDISRKLEGITRNVGTHAGGIVIAPTKIINFTPIYCDSEGHHQVTQFDKNDIEYVGLVKFDLLGLRTLTIINFAIKMINQKRYKQDKLPINISYISIKDKKSFKILQKSETTAIFQLESCGMKDLINKLKPDSLEDIIALLALFRPGPLNSGMVDNFIKRKHGKEIIYYPDKKWQHELLYPILEKTYGIILYQEQVMQIAQVLAGYTLGEADILLRILCKKKKTQMAKQRVIFKNRAKNIGINRKFAMKIFDLIENFAGYGFNKSHSTAYALISYQTLWLKTHYSKEYMAAVMSSDMENTQKLVNIIYECIKMGIKILPPDINKSKYKFYVNNDNNIVFGLGAIKGISAENVKTIINARYKNGKFLDLLDFCVRTNIKKINSSFLEKFILSGAFDCLGIHRAALIHSISKVIKTAYRKQTSKLIGQSDMFNSYTIEKKHNFSKNIPHFTEKEILKGEIETLGIFFSCHPITQYLSEIKKYSGVIFIKDIYNLKYKKKITIVGVIISSRIIINKRGIRIGFCTIDDNSARIEIILLKSILEKYEFFIKKYITIIVSGYINNLNGEIKFIANKIMDIITAREKYAIGLTILLIYNKINIKILKKIKFCLTNYKLGIIPVYINFKIKKNIVRFRICEEFKIKLSDSLLYNLRNIVGNKYIKLDF